MNKILGVAAMIVCVVGLSRLYGEPSFDGKKLSEWMEVWKTGNDEAQIEAAHAMGEMGPRAKVAVPSLLEGTKDGDGYVRLVSAVALRKIDRGVSKKAGLVGATVFDAPALLRALEDRDAAVRNEAVILLGEFEELSSFGRMAEQAVPPLMKILKNDKKKRIRSRAAETLGAMGSAAGKAVPALAEALEDPEASVRISAANALGKIGPAAKGAVPALVAKLDERFVCLVAVEALGKIGPAAAEAVPALIKAFSNDDIRHLVPGTLGRIGLAAQSAIPALAQALSHEDYVTSTHSAQALGEMGPAAASAVPALAEAVANGDSNLRQDAVVALGKIGPLAQGAVPTLIQATKDSNETIRELSAEALTKIDPKAADEAKKTMPVSKWERRRHRPR